MRKISILFLMLIMIFTLSACQLNQAGEKSLTIYTERHYDTDQLLYDQFTEETGIKINLVRDEADKLITRLENEGEDTEADLLIIADAGRLGRAKDLNLLQPVESTILDSNVPETYQDPENYWYALTMRARVIVYHPDRVSESELSTYEDLTDPKWEGRIVTRSSSNIYNQSLMSSFIEIWGEDDALAWAEGLVANFARSPQGNDRDQAKAVVAGEADLAIMNTYYIGKMLYSSDPLEVEVAETIRVFFPNQDTTGTHVNVSGIGVVKYSEKQVDAIKLIEYLTSVDAQSSYANANYEFPVNPLVDPHELLASWGTFNKQNITLNTLSEHATLAAMLMNQAGWV
ncbi:Fe(3+) ABC transporter substrate-binding protein [Tenericutes bacterium MO-XQ]|nr:Fe(3+) ABC transporter substrate-binding protein [Tenericutes bacterium MO-XQ]